MPAAAFADRKYLGAAFGSSTSVSVARGNDKDAPSSLRDSEKLGVEGVPSHAVPEFCQARRDDREVLAAGGTVKPRNILDHNPAGEEFGDDAAELKPETATLTPKTGPSTGHAEVLAGEPSVDKISGGPFIGSCAVNAS